jgi:hypothetical protein
MDIRRQKSFPAYKKARAMAKITHGPSKAGPKPGNRSNNPNGRPPKLMGLEDRRYFKLLLNNKGICEFNRYMRQIILRELNRVIEVAGGTFLSKARFCPRRMDRVYGTVYSIQTQFGELFAQVVVEKQLIEVKLVWNIEACELDNAHSFQMTSFAKKTWPIYDMPRSASKWDGDVTKHVNPEAVEEGDAGNAARLRVRLIQLLSELVPQAREVMEELPNLHWRF